VSEPSLWMMSPSQAARQAWSGPWAYLGKEMKTYRRIRERWGAEAEQPYDQALRDTAEELRQPFLDFVAEVGRLQKDPITWWSTRFSWKLWTASDLFLLLCYLSVAQSLIEEAAGEGRRLLLVIEDPWLLRQLKENLRGTHPGVRVESTVLWKEAALCIAAGTARRIRWLWTVFRNRRKQRRLWPQREPPVPETPTVGIFSYPSQSAFEAAGGWQDAHLPGLDRRIADLGLKIARFTPPECGGWEKELAERSSIAYPLILWATGARVLRSLAAVWRPRWPEQLQVRGRPIRWLCLREGWLEAGRSSLCVYRLYYECLRGMLSQGSWHSLVTFYENQPWEKLQVMAARAGSVRTVGIQTTNFSRYHLSYALGAGEETRVPLPDRIGSSGAAAHRLLLDCGIPSSLLNPCGALRYAHLSEQRSQNADGSDGAELSRVLVVLSIDPVLSRHLLEALQRAFPDGGAGDNLQFIIRPHPMYPIPKEWVRFPAILTPSAFTDFQKALSSCRIVVFTSSMVGFETLARGKTALRYRSPRLFDIDGMYGSFLPVVSDSTLAAELLRRVRTGSPPLDREESEKFLSEHFAPVNPDALAELFQDLPMKIAPERPAVTFA